MSDRPAVSDDELRREITRQLGVNGVLPGLPPMPPRSGNGSAQRFHLQSVESYFRDVEDARKYVENRAMSASEQMLDAIARKRAVPVETIKKEIERLTRGTGWNTPADGAENKVLLALDDAYAYLRVEKAVPRVPPLVVREYAAPRPGFDPAVAASPDTVLWQPVIVLPESGKITIPFHLGYAKSGYQVIVAGHTLDGRLGAVRGIIPIATIDPNQTAAPGAAVPPPAPDAPVPPPMP